MVHFAKINVLFIFANNYHYFFTIDYSYDNKKSICIAFNRYRFF